MYKTNDGQSSKKPPSEIDGVVIETIEDFKTE
ncbi:MAG: hypothetical protein CM15mP59_4250 [Flavobacteriaceae bacterium]|nr:MAG: hypothetical protein CM15mP59_4250 [Flavobacteriaceae bacterium]